MKKQIVLDLNNIEYAAKVTKALSAPVRLEILRLLLSRNINVSEIARVFDLPLSSVSNHVSVLEDADLIITTERPGVRGAQKVCAVACENIHFNLYETMDTGKEESYIYEMGVGHYYDIEVKAPCGIVSHQSYLGIEDNPADFYGVDRLEAELIWFQSGHVEYRFPLDVDYNADITRLLFTFEVCSEAPGYNNIWPSDIALCVNGVDAATIHSHGDYGGVRGALNPSWWSDGSTQYGLLHQLEINSNGTYVDQMKQSDMNIMDIDLHKPYVSLKLAVKEDSEFCGGLNLFGPQFGNHRQGIVMEIFSSRKNNGRVAKEEAVREV